MTMGGQPTWAVRARKAGGVPGRAAPPARARLAAGPVPTDQCVGGLVVAQVRVGWRLELRHDAERERLAQLHTPLVERVDPPDRALREDAVLVEGHQASECPGCQ